MQNLTGLYPHNTTDRYVFQKVSTLDSNFAHDNVSDMLVGI